MLQVKMFSHSSRMQIKLCTWKNFTRSSDYVQFNRNDIYLHNNERPRTENLVYWKEITSGRIERGSSESSTTVEWLMNESMMEVWLWRTINGVLVKCGDLRRHYKSLGKLGRVFASNDSLVVN